MSDLFLLNKVTESLEVTQKEVIEVDQSFSVTEIALYFLGFDFLNLVIRVIYLLYDFLVTYK